MNTATPRSYTVM
ncbi:hypothetical protein HU200_012368 [Digitaria exilis]|uniref:Uncharacterized protein n=1 Tax=Digitaria exilis TaxID=1010633 RepID=A0A835FFJ1_9POAL|nr:hypothetical protein HU200_012368 [Digitaria exilis]